MSGASDGTIIAESDPPGSISLPNANPTCANGDVAVAGYVDESDRASPEELRAAQHAQGYASDVGEGMDDVLMAAGASKARKSSLPVDLSLFDTSYAAFSPAPT